MDLIERLIEIKGMKVKERRKKKYRSNVRTLERLANEPILTVVKDMRLTRRLAERIEASKFAPWTRADLNLLLKVLWKVGNGHDLADSPKEIRWLLTTVARKDKKHPKKISENELGLMLKIAKGRNRAMIHLLYEAGLRPHEILTLRKCDLEFEEKGVRVHVREGSKTGARDILVMDSEPALAAWLAVHPLRKQDALLFPAEHGGGMSVEGLNKMVKTVAGEAGITRRIKTYDFRHTSATRWARLLTDSQMRAFFGWTQDSKMAGTYVDMSGRDVDSAILAAHGKKSEKNELEGKLSPLICARCGKQNAFDATMCQYCGCPADKEEAKRSDLAREERMKSLENELAGMRKIIRAMAKQTTLKKAKR